MVGRKEDFALERQRAGNMQQVNGPRSKPFGVCHREIGCSKDDRIQVQRDVQQGAAGQEAFEPVQRGIPPVRSQLPLAAWQRAAFVERALEDRIWLTGCLSNQLIGIRLLRARLYLALRG